MDLYWVKAKTLSRERSFLFAGIWGQPLAEVIGGKVGCLFSIGKPEFETHAEAKIWAETFARNALGLISTNRPATDSNNE